MPSFYLTINDAVRAKIDKLVESKGLDANDYPYSSDAAISLNQLSAILGGSGNSQSIADSIGEVLKNVGESGGGGFSSGPVLEWTQLAGSEDVFEYDSSNGQHAITIDDKFGCTTINDLEELCRKWVFVKWTYNGETKYSYAMPFIEDYGGTYSVEWLTTITLSSYCEVVVNAEYANSVLSSVSLYVRGDDLPSDDTSGVSIYAAEITGWNE